MFYILLHKTNVHVLKCSQSSLLSYNHTLLPEAHTSTWHWAVCRLQAGVCTQRTTALGADGGTGWRIGTGSCSVDILADILLRWYQLVEYCCRRSQGTGRSYYWALQGPVHQTRVAEEAGHLWRDATSSFATGATGLPLRHRQDVSFAYIRRISEEPLIYHKRRNPVGDVTPISFLSNFPCWTERLSSGKQRFGTSL